MENKNMNPVIIDENLCNGCGRCAELCVYNVIVLRDRTDGSGAKVAYAARPEACMFCESCVIGCREAAVMLNAEAGSSMIKKINDNMIKPKKRGFRFFK